MPNKYCMCIINQKKKKNESIGFMPTPKSMLKSAGLDLDSAQLGLRKVKKIAIPVVSVSLAAFVGSKIYKAVKSGSNNSMSDRIVQIDLYTPSGIRGPIYFSNVDTFERWLESKGIPFDNRINDAWDRAQSSETRNKEHLKLESMHEISLVRPIYVKQRKLDFDGFAYVAEVHPKVYNNLKPGEYLDSVFGLSTI